jgi:hypothetical protein
VRAHPWRRWFARITDVSLAALVIGLVVGIADPTSPLFETSGVVWNLLALLVWVPVDGLLLATFGSTPGKRLLGMSVRTEAGDGGRLDLGQALNRSFRVWFFGLGAGIPIVSLITMVVAHERLKKNGTTSWDRDVGAVVLHRPVTVEAMVLLALLWIGLLALIGWGATP